MRSLPSSLLCATLPEPCPDLGAWWPLMRAAAAPGPSRVARAILAGARADRIGFAFVAGYQEALRALVPALSDDRVAGFAVTEPTGTRPKHIMTRVDGAGDGTAAVSGTKSFATLASDADVLIVAGRSGTRGDGRPQLTAVQVDLPAAGVRLEPGPSPGFVPEVGHAQVHLSGAVGRILPGDGYDDYVKPFRTIEDLHVFAAVTACLVRHGAAAKVAPGILERGCATLSGLLGLEAQDPRSPMTHLALAGLLSHATQVADSVLASAEILGDPVGARLLRDRPLLQVAGAAREARRARAWSQREASVR